MTGVGTITITEKTEKNIGSAPNTNHVESPIPVRGKVSAKWQGISEWMRSDSPMAKGLEKMLDQVDLEGLKSIASGLRNGMNCHITDNYTCGAYNIVFEIVFDDGVSWIARLRSASHMQIISQEFVFESPTYKQHMMESEIATMKYVREHTSIPVPEVYAFETTSNNPAKLPYILMECIDGHRVPAKARDLPSHLLKQILHELAGVLLKLSTLQFPKIGNLYENSDGRYRIDTMLDRKGKKVGPFTSSTEYYRWRAEQPLVRSNNSSMDLKDAFFHSYLYKLSLPFLMNGFRPEGPFPLAHNDLGTHNTLFDNDGNLKGVIDWTGACVVPWESFAQLPGGVMMGPYLRSEFSDHIYHFNRYKVRVFLDSMKRHEQQRQDENDVSLTKLLGSPASELAECMEQYDLSALRSKYRRKLCRLLFGPDVDPEMLKKSVFKSELFDDGSVGIYKNGADRKSSGLGDSNGICIGDTRNGTSSAV